MHDISQGKFGQTQAIVDLNIFKGEKFIRIKYVYKLKGNGNKNFYLLIWKEFKNNM